MSLKKSLKHKGSGYRKRLRSKQLLKEKTSSRKIKMVELEG